VTSEVSNSEIIAPGGYAAEGTYKLQSSGHLSRSTICLAFLIPDTTNRRKKRAKTRTALDEWPGI
jgi:hypothetical protein